MVVAVAATSILRRDVAFFLPHRSGRRCPTCPALPTMFSLVQKPRGCWRAPSGLTDRGPPAAISSRWRALLCCLSSAGRRLAPACAVLTSAIYLNVCRRIGRCIPTAVRRAPAAESRCIRLCAPWRPVQRPLVRWRLHRAVTVGAWLFRCSFTSPTWNAAPRLRCSCRRDAERFLSARLPVGRTRVGTDSGRWSIPPAFERVAESSPLVGCPLAALEITCLLLPHAVSQWTCPRDRLRDGVVPPEERALPRPR